MCEEPDGTIAKGVLVYNYDTRRGGSPEAMQPTFDRALFLSKIFLQIPQFQSVCSQHFAFFDGTFLPETISQSSS